MKSNLPIRKAVLKKKTYEPPAEGRLSKLRLDFNENTSGCSPAVLRAIAKLSAKQLAMYPEYQPCTKSLARYFKVHASELLITNGGDDALRVFFDTFVDAGSSIVICEPTFPMYRFYAEIYGANVEVCRFNSTMEFPVDDIVRALKTKPRVVFIANPNNPTGSLLNVKQLQLILKSSTDTAVVIDEAYSDFCKTTAVPLIGKYAHLFVVKTFSKAPGLAGLRLGAVIARQDSLRALRGCLPPFPVNGAALVAAEAAIRDVRFTLRYVKENRRVRESFETSLGKLGITTFPSEANFILANFGRKGPRLFRQLEDRGILLRERSRQIAPGYVRISIGTAVEMSRLLIAIRRLWRPERPRTAA